MEGRQDKRTIWKNGRTEYGVEGRKDGMEGERRYGMTEVRKYGRTEGRYENTIWKNDMEGQKVGR
jgi:hypothetical protein